VYYISSHTGMSTLAWFVCLIRT